MFSNITKNSIKNQKVITSMLKPNYLMGFRVLRFVSSFSNVLNFHNEKLLKYLEGLRKEFYNSQVNINSARGNQGRFQQLSAVVILYEKYRILKGNLIAQNDIDAERDIDMQQLMIEENQLYGNLLKQIETELLTKMESIVDEYYYPCLLFEVNSGAGGQEAMLFAKELFNMYRNYFNYRKWHFEILDEDFNDIGGLRHAKALINEDDAYYNLRYEAGVHRVQRIPATEKAGRIHTSTASVAVIPKPIHIDIHINEKDLKIETKRASGPGGQHVNTTDSAVRIVHIPTGIACESQKERSQTKNKEICLRKLHAKLLDKQLESTTATIKNVRKAQQGHLDRNEKIRTYNFVQDRITDHRLQNDKGTTHNIKEFLKGGEELDNFNRDLVSYNRQKLLVELIENWQDDKAENKA